MTTHKHTRSWKSEPPELPYDANFKRHIEHVQIHPKETLKSELQLVAAGVTAADKISSCRLEIWSFASILNVKNLVQTFKV